MPKCLNCGLQLPKEIKQEQSHDKTCPWKYYIECQECGYQNNINKLLGFGPGCSEECRKKLVTHTYTYRK